jgi:DNA-binding ferritin-like protein
LPPCRSESDTFKSAFRDLKEDLERTRDILAAAIDDAAERLGHFGYRFPDPDEDPKGAEWTSLYRRSIRAMLKRHSNMDEELAAALKNFDRETRPATRRFKTALIRETAEG